MASQIVRLDTLRTLAFGGISGTYATLGTAFTHPMRLVRIVNNTNGDLTLGFNGSTDNIFCPANSFVLYDCTTNRDVSDPSFVFAIGTQFFVKGSPSSGSVYLEAMYGQGD